MKKLLTLLFTLAFVPGLWAQGDLPTYTAADGTKQTYLETRFYGRIVDSLTREPLPSAVVSVVSAHQMYGRSVRNYVTDKQGNFSFVCLVDRQNRMEVSYLGYKILQASLIPDGPEHNLGALRMSQDVQAIDNVVVKARMQMYKMKGDTIIYLPKAINTMEGDKALEILRHMPGVDVSDRGNVTINGELVSRTYVNSKLLFGEDPTTALKQLDASEVASIEAYDEEDEDAQARAGKNAKKRKVLNVVTFKQFAKSFSARALAEAGTDFNKDVQGERPARYRAEGELGFYSERLQVAASGKTDNRPQTGVAYPATSLRASDANASVSGKQGQNGTFSTRYSYTDTRTTNEGFSRQEYFPTADFTSQRILDSTRTDQRAWGHTLAAGYSYRTDAWNVSANMNGNIGDAMARNFRNQQTDRNGAPLSSTMRNEAIGSDNAGINGSLNATRMWKKNLLSLNFTAAHYKSDASTLREDWQTAQRQTLESRINLPTSRVNGNLNYSIDTDNAGSFSVGIGAGMEPRTYYTLTVDPATGSVDAALSEDNKGNTVTVTPSVGYTMRKDQHFLTTSVTYAMQSVSFENRTLGEAQQTRFFQVPQVMFIYNYNPSPKRSLGVMLNNMLYPISSRRLFSTKIDDRNPMHLSAGNPSLKPMVQYQLNLTGNLTGKKTSSLELGLNLTLSHREEISRYLYFAQSTVLEQYGGYVAPAGSTLSIPDNGDYSLSIGPSATFKTRLSPLKCFLELLARYRYGNPQQWVEGRLTRSQRHFGEFSVGLTTNFSPDFRITLKSSSTYDWYRNSSGYTDKGFSERFDARLRWDFLGSMFFTTNFTLEVFRNSTNSAIRADNYILNASLGYRVLKRRGSLTFNAYDILNRNSGFSMRQYDQFVSYSWQRLCGSYFAFAFEYKFNNRK